MMNEKLIQFIWQHKLFKVSDLRTVHGELVEILKVGFLNDYDGPDFSDARLRIDGLEWAGTVEIHQLDTEWLAHGHQNDKRYNSVILHVVWELKNEESVPEGVPCLVLKPYVDQKLLRNYSQLMHSQGQLPCAYGLASIESIHKSYVLDDKLYTRLRRKAVVLTQVLNDFQNNWQQLFFYLLAMALGKKANKKPMSQLVDKLKLDVLAKHSDSPLAIEAMILGTAGLLDADDTRCAELKKEFEFWQAKYQIKPMSGLEWNFSKTRGSGKPYLALSILASCVSLLHQVDDLKKLNSQDLLLLHVSHYWQEFNSFGQKSAKKHRVTNRLIEHLEINLVVPFLGVMGNYYQQDDYFEQAYSILESKPMENNTIVKKLLSHGFLISDASSSQGGIELYNEYCLKKRCLDCRIGQLLIQA